MKRSHRRMQAFLGSELRRLFSHVRRALTTDEDVTVERGESERAGARDFARSAAALRGGMAKVAQLQAYLHSPGAATDAEARGALAALWDQAPGDDPIAIRKVIEEDLGAPPEQLFAHWEDQPMAAASLGQVHAATGHDGTKLAVKVQYPGVAEALRDDLESGGLLRKLAGAEIGGALSDEAIAALRAGILDELDYVSEAQNLLGFRRAFASDRQVVIPRPHPRLSSKRVLAMDRLEGRSLGRFAAEPDGERRAAVSRVLFRFGFASPIIHGLLNADPNPGNYLVIDDDPAAPLVGFLDFGCAVEIEDAVYAADRKLWLAMVHRDGEAMRYAVYEQGLIADPKVLDTSTFRAWEQALAAPFLGRDPFELGPEHVRELTDLTSKLIRARGMAMPAHALLLWRQRLGVLSVIASLRPRLRFREALADLLDDGRNPQRLYERYP